MNNFPALLDAPLRARLAALGVRPEEVEERFVRGAGAGGQKINKTSSTVWLRHRPTGFEVRCQRERAQSVNRRIAWLELVGRLEARVGAVDAAARDVRELARRRSRSKPRGVKRLMVSGKRHRARLRSARRTSGADGW